MGKIKSGAVGAGGPLYLTQDLAPGWRAWFYVARTETGALTIARVEVKPWGAAPPEHGVTQALLRKITIGAAQRIVGLYNPDAAVRPSPLKPFDGKPTQLQLRKLLARFTYLVNDAKDFHPAKTLAAELKQPRTTVRTWILRAKRLPPL